MEKSASASSLEQEVIEDAFVCKSKDTSFTEDNVFYGITRSNILCSTVAGQNVCVFFFGGGVATWQSETYGGRREKSPENV